MQETSIAAHRSALSVELQQILQDRLIRTCFQPIVSLKDGAVLGYEALSRGPSFTRLEAPLNLFAEAEQYGVSWEIDTLCRNYAIERFAEFQSDSLLFLNVAPHIIQDPRFRAAMAIDSLMELIIPPTHIILELTEKAALTNYAEYVSLLEYYKTQGYRLAVDDAGAGYAGWNLICQAKPAFMKVNMGLVRDIQRDAFKQQMMKVTVDFARATGTALIAEGIESDSELLTLLELGVEYGQGFFLHNPETTLSTPANDLVDKLRECQRRRLYKRMEHVSVVRVGDCCESPRALPATIRVAEVDTALGALPGIRGITVVNPENVPVGLVMRDKFFALLGRQYGYSLYQNRKVRDIMDADPLVVDFNEPLESVAQAATLRGDHRQYDNIIVTLNGHYFGMVTIITLLERITEQSVNYATYTNPLSGLPGNIIIEREIERVLHNVEPFSVIYLDLDNFKAYNDALGFERGDCVLKFTADLLCETFTGDRAFVGHIGGDDFVVVLDTEVTETVLKQFMTSFDTRITSYYDEEHIKAGCIRTLNRRGEMECFPIMSISIAVVTKENGPFASYQEVARRAAEIKKICKATRGSCAFFDRRGTLAENGACCPGSAGF